MISIFSTLLLLALTSSSLISAGKVVVPARPLPATVNPELNNWAQFQYSASLEQIERSLQAPGGAPGSVVAAPSKSEPDYYYHWVRDASLTMGFLAELYAQGQTKYEPYLVNYGKFSRRLQETPNRSGGLGEPKFNLDGTAFNGDWGRPQNDGPALRAVALGTFAHTQADKNKETNYLYWAELPARSVIKADLEFVSRAWQESSFDVWEEVRGQHFYTRLAHWKALKDGAKLAQRFNDSGASGYYTQTAQKVKASLDSWWVKDSSFIQTTYGYEAGIDYKKSGIDVQVILAALHSGSDKDDTYGPSSDRILATTVKVIDAFADLYTVNRRNRVLGTAIGRYPEDQYNGAGTSIGNPWFLATTAIAEVNYKVAATASEKGAVQVTALNVEFYNRALKNVAGATPLKPGDVLKQGDLTFTQLLNALKLEGDRYLMRVKFHSEATGNLREQFNRDSGFQQGATQLTWSHVALCTAWRARQLISPELL